MNDEGETEEDETGEDEYVDNGDEDEEDEEEEEEDGVAGQPNGIKSVANGYSKDAAAFARGW